MGSAFVYYEFLLSALRYKFPLLLGVDLGVTVSLNITTNLLFLGTAKLFSIVTETINFFFCKKTLFYF